MEKNLQLAGKVADNIDKVIPMLEALEEMKK
jgi:hypothetical protein